MEKPAQFRLKASELMPLSVKSDFSGVMRALGHFGAMAIAGTALWNSIGTCWAIPLTAITGYLIAFLFTTEHEMAHQTAFKTRTLNYICGHFAGFAILLPYEYYRAYHWDHHRYTQDPAKDPELAVPLPTTRFGLVFFWSGIPTWIDRVRMLLVHGVKGKVTKPWVPENKRGLIAREARFYLLGYLTIIVVSIATRSPAALLLWVVPVVVGQWFLRPYLLAEHTGCEHGPNMLANTRTTYTNALIRFFAWNMPYHVEHHAYPVVPFHALPKLNAILATHITNTEKGYPASTVSVLRYIKHEIRGEPVSRPQPTDS
ncbi:fatty acid desaturase [Cupriavidus basilensis]|uniref:Fatty acid desaturase n=1 Tax=Cupriavidus basilensis TaxID=68895 RepID=A0A643FKE3_9BURK|nr:fatty acid desaturase [Cupriavidus basilensis]QOT82055.1 fatty acid desaturase [Cupriavidus basilensis]